MKLSAKHLLEEALRRVSGGDKLAGMIDSTLLSQMRGVNAYLNLIAEAQQYGFRAVVVPSVIPRFKEFRDAAGKAGVRFAVVVGFPHGGVPLDAKILEARHALEAGAWELDFVPWLGGGPEYVRSEVEKIVEVAREYGAKVKVIVEASLHTSESLGRIVDAVARAGADAVKTSTGVYTKGGDPITVYRTWKEASRHGLPVKAAGGIRTALDALLAVGAGASIIGTSSARSVVESFEDIAGVTS